MGGVHRVAHENDVVDKPVLAPNRGETSPYASVLDESVTGELFGEQLCTVSSDHLFLGVLHPRRAPGLLCALDDERRSTGLILVRVNAPESVFVLAEVEGERGERLGRTEPHEAVGAPIERRLETVGQRVPDGRIRAVRADNDIVVFRSNAIFTKSGKLGLEPNIDAEFCRLFLKNR